MPKYLVCLSYYRTQEVQCEFTVEAPDRAAAEAIAEAAVYDDQPAVISELRTPEDGGEVISIDLHESEVLTE
jgi:hypothetical protein